MSDGYFRKNGSLFLKFGLTGGAGTVVNLAVFYLFADLGGLSATLSSTAAFCIAVSFNYLINQNWTFRQESGRTFHFSSYIRYVGVNIFGLLVNLFVLNALIWFFHPAFLLPLQAAGIAAAMLFNFILSKIYVFKA